MELGGVPAVAFSAARRAQLEEQCDDLIERALRVHDQFHGSAAALDAWKLVRRRDALSVYRLRHERKLSAAGDDREPGESPASSSSSASGGRERARSRALSRSKRQRLLLGSGIVRGSADDAIAGVYCDSTEQLRVVKTLLNDSFIDGAVLKVFERHPLHAPVVFAGIKWFALKGIGSGQIVRDRDFLTYERMGRIVDHRRGQVFTYQVIQSVDLPEIPANRDNIARARMSWCYLYRQLDRDWLGCFMLGDVDSGGGMGSSGNANGLLSVPRPLDDFVSADRLLAAVEFRVVVRARAFSRLMSSSADLLPSSSSKRCDRCLATISKLLGASLVLCMGCKKCVCRACRCREHVFRLRARTGKPEREFFCRTCVDSVDSMRASVGSISSEYSNSVTGSDQRSTGTTERHRQGEAAVAGTDAGERCASSLSSPAHSMSPTQEWSELDLDDTILSDDEDDGERYASDEFGDSYASSFHADEAELRKLASFTRRCSIVDDARHGSSNNNQAQHASTAAAARESSDIWWNPKEMERLAKYLDKQKKRERRHRQEYDSQSDYDRPRASSDLNSNNNSNGESSGGAGVPSRTRGPNSVYSGASSNGTDRSAYSHSAYDGMARETTLTSQRSFVVYDEELQDYVRLHDPERAGLPPSAPARPNRPPRGTVFSVDELD